MGLRGDDAGRQTRCDAYFIEKAFRPTGLFGPFGAAASATRLLGGHHPQAVDALALAGNHGSGLCQWAEAGTRDGPLQNANAARAGVQAALLAMRGIRAPADLLEGKFGFLQAYAGGTSTLDQPWPVADKYAMDEIYFKNVPSCAFTQETLEAGIQLHRRRVMSENIAAIVISTYWLGKAYPGCDYSGPFKTQARSLQQPGGAGRCNSRGRRLARSAGAPR